MTPERPLPWTALVAAIGENRLEEIARALAEAKTDPLERDAFLLNGEAGRLHRELVPEDAPAEAVTGYGALLHMLFVHWQRGWPVTRVDEPALRSALEGPTPHAPPSTPSFVCYLQLPPRLVWAEPAPGAPHEPLDGAFVIAEPGRLRALAVLGFRPEREGFTTIESELALPAPPPAARPGGGAPFASLLPAGDRARLFSVADAHELAVLALLALGAAQR